MIQVAVRLFDHAQRNTIAANEKEKNDRKVPGEDPNWAARLIRDEAAFSPSRGRNFPSRDSPSFLQDMRRISG